MSESKPLCGTLENWRLVDWCKSKGDQVVCGWLYGDDRFEDGTEIRTSGIVKLDRENNTLETRNSIYKLGKEL